MLLTDISECDAVTYAVPQGINLGPIIHLTFVNRFCLDNSSQVKFVDLTICKIIDVNNGILYS